MKITKRQHKEEENDLKLEMRRIYFMFKKLCLVRLLSAKTKKGREQIRGYIKQMDFIYEANTHWTN